MLTHPDLVSDTLQSLTHTSDTDQA
jgi:hypothetical protein